MYIVLNCKIRIRVPYDSMSMGSPSVMYREWRIRFWGGESNRRQRAARRPTIHSSSITHRCRHTSCAYLCQSHTRVRTTWRVTVANISGLSGAQQLEFIQTIRIAFGIGREAGKRECEQVCCSWQVLHLVITESRWASEGFKSRAQLPTGLTSASKLTYQSMPTGFYDSLFIIIVNPGKGFNRKVELETGFTGARQGAEHLNSKLTDKSWSQDTQSTPMW